jgi:uncharacterized protein YecE (DUF72 family)
MEQGIRVGISAWADKTLIASGFYPKHHRDPASRLAFYASRFSLVENDAPYYALPTRERMQTWADRTPPGFTMNVKAFALLTQHYTDPRRLPPELRRALPEELQDKPRVYPKDLDPFLLAEIAMRFRDALAPLRKSGRLGLVLFQYPVWVPAGRETRALIASARGLLPDDRVAIEFRNATWMSEDARDETLAFLRDNELVYTCVDEPQGFPSSVPPVAAATADVALVRMHGRNRARWDKALQSARERFDYRYSVAELEEWVPRVRELSRRARTVHVIMNNCFSDHAVVNATQLAALLEAPGEATAAA